MKTATRMGIAALTITAAMLPAALAGTAMAASAADITVNAGVGDTLAGHSFDVYRIGTYKDYADKDGNGRADGVNVVNDADQAWLAEALRAAKVDVATAKGLDEAGTIASQSAAGTLSTIANALAKSAAKPTPVLTGQTSDTGALTLTVPGEGLYLLVDDAGLPIIVGTKIGGMDLENQALGVAVVKSTVVTVDKTGAGDTTLGSTVTYTVTFRIPAKNTNPTKLTYTDAPTDLRIDKDSLSYTIEGGATAKPIVTDNADGGFTWDATGLLADANHGKAVTLAYTATVTGRDPHNKGTLNAVLDGKNAQGDTGTGGNLTNFDFDLKKTRADHTTPIAGAGFVIRNTRTGKWLKWDAAGVWDFIDAADAADAKAQGAERLTDAQGGLSFDGLGDGEYEVTESTVPTGYLPTPATFTVTIAGGKAQVKGTGMNDGLTDAQTDMAENGTVTVRNLDSIGQLAETGAAGLTLTVAAAALLAVGAGTAYRLRRKADA